LSSLETDQEFLDALRALLEERSRGPFISKGESRADLERMIAARRRLLGLSDPP
jgi:hypothetical protein